MSYCNAFSATDHSKKKCSAHPTAHRAPAEDRSRLYLLSYLLTADRAKAERCFVAGLDLSAEDNAAFRDWAHSWARRVVIHNALRLIAPHPVTGAHDADSSRVTMTLPQITSAS
jgi:hypothetical protein